MQRMAPWEPSKRSLADTWRAEFQSGGRAKRIGMAAVLALPAMLAWLVFYTPTIDDSSGF